MANATAITINELTTNSVAVLPSADVLDTGTSPVTLNVPVKGDLRRVVLLIKNTDGTNAMTVAIKASTSNPPGFRTGLGDLSQSVALSATRVFAGLESARFCKSDGSVDISFTPAAGTIGVQITAFRLPKHV